MAMTGSPEVASSMEAAVCEPSTGAIQRYEEAADSRKRANSALTVPEPPPARLPAGTPADPESDRSPVPVCTDADADADAGTGARVPWAVKGGAPAPPPDERAGPPAVPPRPKELAAPVPPPPTPCAPGTPTRPGAPPT